MCVALLNHYDSGQGQCGQSQQDVQHALRALGSVLSRATDVTGPEALTKINTLHSKRKIKDYEYLKLSLI